MAHEKIFNICEIREKILKYVIHRNSDNNGLSAPDIVSCRLVSKQWFQSISNCLSHSKTPVIHIDLFEYCAQYTLSNKESKILPFKEEPEKPGKSLDCFIKQGSLAQQHNREMFPSFSLSIKEEFLKPENYPILSQLFTECASGLVESQLVCIRNSMPLPFPNIPPLRKLQKMTIFSFTVFTRLAATSNTAAFIQSIFSACENLREVKFDVNTNSSQFCVENFLLPRTLTKVALSFWREQNEWQVLTRNKLPNLTNLTLHCGYQTWTDREIVRILENVSGTLKTLKLILRYGHYKPLLGNPAVVVPAMKKLEHFTFHNQNEVVHIKPSMLTMQEIFPNLRSLHLPYVRVPELKMWAGLGAFKTVKEVTIKLKIRVNDLTLEETESIRLFFKAFPNLQTLELDELDVKEVKVVRCIFEELTQLKQLKLGLEDDERVVNSGKWDALLIGIPEEFVVALGKNLEPRRNADLQKDTIPSIRNLTKLHSLDLRANPIKLDTPLISNAVFHFSFFKMPQLRILKLIGRFEVSDEMVEKWKNMDKEIESFRGTSDDFSSNVSTGLSIDSGLARPPVALSTQPHFSSRW